MTSSKTTSVLTCLIKVCRWSTYMRPVWPYHMTVISSWTMPYDIVSEVDTEVMTAPPSLQKRWGLEIYRLKVGDCGGGLRGCAWVCVYKTKIDIYPGTVAALLLLDPERRYTMSVSILLAICLGLAVDSLAQPHPCSKCNCIEILLRATNTAWAFDALLSFECFCILDGGKQRSPIGKHCLWESLIQMSSSFKSRHLSCRAIQSWYVLCLNLAPMFLYIREILNNLYWCDRYEWNHGRMLNFWDT